jgi:hypothetical protein
MRIWDIHPGYLNRQSLLGEHRELHGIVSIIVNNRKGYSHHPETVRWVGYGWALKMRHQQMACEMALRGYTDRSPVDMTSGERTWPSQYVDEPGRQYQLLREKYRDKEPGRIPLPLNPQQLWSQHKYSVLARDQKRYKAIGRDAASGNCDFSELARVLAETLRTAPTEGGIRNALQHMWGHVSHENDQKTSNIDNWPLKQLLTEIQKRTGKNNESYLIASTALSDLMVWLMSP